MSVHRPVLVWFSHRPLKLEQQHFAVPLEHLDKHGYEVRWIQIEDSSVMGNVNRVLMEEIPQSVSAYLFGGKDLDWFRPILSAVRSLGSKPEGLAPFIWIYEEVDRHLLQVMADEGFDDFISVSMTASEMLTRMTLRINQFRAALERQHERSEESVRLVRNETIMKQREEFLGVCAHDLRSPLGLIQSSAAMILNNHSGKGTLSPTEYELVNRIKRQSSHALNLVKDLLDVMSFEQGFLPQYALLNLNDLLIEFSKDCRGQAESVKLNFHYSNLVPDWRVFADADRVRQLLQNLVNNAIKFTGTGKNIYLGVNSFKGRRKADPPYPMVIISLRDEGDGMGQREMQKIFDRFSALKQSTNKDGRGLGLTVAKQISMLHEGNIWVESTEGKGSTFNVLFPHAISRTLPLSTEERMAKGNRIRILIADSSEDRREKYWDAVREEGYEFLFAKDSVDALSLLFHSLPDLLILTPDLTKMDLLEVVRLMKSDVLTASIPIFLAAEESDKVENRFETHKFDRLLRLPCEKEMFQNTLRSVGIGKEKIKRAA